MLTLLMLACSWAPPNYEEGQKEARRQVVPHVHWVACEPMPLDGMVVSSSGSFCGDARPCCWVSVLFNDGTFYGKRLDQNCTPEDIEAAVKWLRAWRPPVKAPVEAPPQVQVFQSSRVTRGSSC